MAAVALLGKDHAQAETQDVLAAAEKHFGHLPNLVKALANNPAICAPITNFLIQALGPGRLDWGLKELVILKTLRSVKSHYSFGAHERLAIELGVPAEKIGDLANSLWRTSPRFDEGERVLVEFVEQVAKDANDVSDELWQRLRRHWDNGQLLELNAMVATFIMIGKVGDAMGISDPVLFTIPVGAR